MSGDVQPRKRKDKKRKRDGADRKSEGEVSFSRQSSVQDDDESSHGVHITKMGSDDVHLHVHHDHGTGGHWCAKILFFSLLAVLLGLVGLIILENRGLSDLDTPLSESRFSNYFDGWVEEHRQEHDDHDPVQASIEEHDEHGEPFEEEEDDGDENEDDDDDDDNEHADDDEKDHDDKDDEEDDEDDGDEVEAEGEDDDEDTKDESQEVKDDNNDDDETNDDDNEEDVTTEDNDNEDSTEVNKKTTEDNKDDDDDDDDDNNNDDDDDEDNNDNDNDDDDDDNDNNSQNKNKDDDNDNDNDNDDDDDDDDEDVDDNVSAPIKSSTLHSHNVGNQQQQANADDDDEDDDPFDEEDDDGTFESMETVVDNDAEELSLLQEKARQQAAEAAKNTPPPAEDDADDPAKDAPSWASSLAVKIGVGVALALVARIVLLRKNPNATDEPVPEVLMKRRLTIATAEDTFPEDEDVPPLPTEDEELLGEEEEEEIVVEEEIEYIETDDENSPVQNIGTFKQQQKRYMPETFEELNAMYKPFTAAKTEETAPDALAKAQLKAEDVIYRKSPSSSPSPFKTDVRSESVEADPEPVLGVKNTPENVTLYDARPNTSAATGAIPKVDKNKESTFAKGTTREVTHDVDYQPEDEDIDYDIDDDVYEEEEVVEEEDELEGDDDANGDGDVSDFDDEELMNRLEMKYGKLPQREHEYESDEDPDDPTWTQIKPKEARGGGPQVDANSDMFEQELRRANEEMMRENYAVALNAFDMLSRKFPDQPQVFLGKAQILDRLSARERSNKLLYDALEAYKRYLAFGELIESTAFRAAAERCIERMRFLGSHIQTLPIHEQLMERFSDEVGFRNQLVVSYLMMNRLSDARRVLQETLSRWPTDGFAQVHYGFVLKQLDKDYQNAVVYLKSGIESQAEGTQDGRFFFNLGDALQRLGRNQEAIEVYRRGVQLKLFPSVYQRSLYNEPNLRAQPFWSKKETTYDLYLEKLEQNWLAIRDEGLSLLGKRGNFLDEVENLRDTGDWQQFELFVRGQRIHKNCQKAPITCSLIELFNAASGCRRGQVKFSVMQPATHVWSHCGPTNCRLRAHLGLVVPQGTRLRVADEERSWIEGKFLIFDDSFEHEVWHEGSSLRLVLIVDVWHPDLTEKQRQRLTPI